MKPLIGLVGRRFAGRHIAGNLGVLAPCPIDVYYAEYGQAISEAGGLPVWIPVDSDPVEIVERLDAIVMTGGTDIEPARYGQAKHEAVLETSPQRDESELATLDAALARRLPTLGICRGLQIINVHAGGTLHQHQPEHAFTDGPGDALTHSVSFVEGSVLAECYGQTHMVNSLHHQQAAKVGAGLRVTGTAPDGAIEAIEHEELPIVAVQWHPEMLSDTRPTDPLFDWLVSRARSDASMPGQAPTHSP